jgi:PTH1 family peptidyl-tRNA hydrolase
MIKLIAGLGNPGDRYESTRHNIGFLAIDRMLKISPAKNERYLDNALVFETEKFGLLCKPLTYMNNSGRAFRGLTQTLGLNPEEILVVYDDFALELGLIRIRERGSAGGHNGLQSIIDSLGSTEIPRIRLGIKTDEMDDWADFVLSRFKKSEHPIVDQMLDSCIEAVEVIRNEGIILAMNRFNRKQKLVNGQNSG